MKGISPRSSLENTGQMKQFLLQNLHDEGIEEMLTLREQLLRKRESEAIRKAHEDLSGKKISEAEF